MMVTKSSDSVDVNNITISQEKKIEFKNNGFIKIENVFTDKAVDSFREVADRHIESSKDANAKYGETFDKLSYGLGQERAFKEIYESSSFKEFIKQLIPQNIIATESNGFSLTKNKTGFPWHYGSLSFRYIKALDMAWSIWIPLNEIDPNEQGGGMAYIPEHIMSCQGNYQMSSIVSDLRKRNIPYKDITNSLNKLYGFKGRITTDIFETIKYEDSFQPGDAFIFNKNVWHRSSPLKEGRLEKRLAVNMRFIDVNSRLDMLRYEQENETAGGLGLGVDFGRQTQTTFGSHFIDIEDGDYIKKSKYCGYII